MSLNKAFNEELQQRVADIEALLQEYLPEEGKAGQLQQTMIQAMNYSMLAGGKRLRPLLMGEIYRAFGGTEQAIRPFQAAMEMIHTFSLVHDDLPCMDNDRYRRGKLTTWAVYGEDQATLAGDALSLYAFETAAKAFSISAHPERVGEAIGILAKEAGVYGMCGGQAVDVELTGHAMNAEQLQFVYEYKTGALLKASMEIGSVLAGASKEDQERVCQVANAVGMAFQIRDDILDITSTEEVLGKPIGSDEKNHKVTYVTLHGLDAAEQKVRELSEQAVSLLPENVQEEQPFLTELIRMLITREK